MSDIVSAVQPQDSDFLWCAGYAFRNPADEDAGRYAVVFKMDSDGDISFLYKWGSRKDIGDKDAENVNNDVARAINYDDIRKEIVVLMEVTSEGLRPDYQKYS